MKKVFLTMCFTLATVVVVGANSLFTSPLTPELTEDYGCARDCINTSVSLVQGAADDNGEGLNDDPIYMTVYLALYESCYQNNCQ
jgi:hypothetical protein